MNEIKNTKYKLHLLIIFVYILITPLSMVEIPGIGSAMKALSILIFVIGALLLISENVTFKINNPLVLAWSAYVFYTSLSIFWSTNFESSLQTAIGLIQVFVISIILSKFNIYEEDIRIIELAWIITSLICLMLFFGGAGQQYEYGGRTTIVLRSGGADPNEFCAYFYMTLAFIIVRLFRNKSILINLMYFSYMLIIFYCILSTGSRGGLLAAIAVVFVSWIFSTSISFKKIALLCILMVTLYLVFIYFFVPNLPQPMLERFQLSSMIEDKGSDRVIIWETAFNDIFSGTSRLIYGYGPFGITFMRYTMHNQFLQALMDGGIIGLILYLIFFIVLARKAYRNGPAFLGGIAGAFVALMTLSAYAFFKPIWIIFLMCLLTISKKGTVENNE
ncbi:MAG: O-antigen ligase family protein [Eubacteriales bacterium]|nr:O-antigen ligase family protein [Eubacteriales bacterium]